MLCAAGKPRVNPPGCLPGPGAVMIAGVQVPGIDLRALRAVDPPPQRGALQAVGVGEDHAFHMAPSEVHRPHMWQALGALGAPGPSRSVKVSLMTPQNIWPRSVKARPLNIWRSVTSSAGGSTP